MHFSKHGRHTDVTDAVQYTAAAATAAATALLTSSRIAKQGREMRSLQELVAPRSKNGRLDVPPSGVRDQTSAKDCPRPPATLPVAVAFVYRLRLSRQYHNPLHYSRDVVSAEITVEEAKPQSSCLFPTLTQLRPLGQRNANWATLLRMMGGSSTMSVREKAQKRSKEGWEYALRSG